MSLAEVPACSMQVATGKTFNYDLSCCCGGFALSPNLQHKFRTFAQGDSSSSIGEKRKVSLYRPQRSRPHAGVKPKSNTFCIAMLKQPINQV